MSLILSTKVDTIHLQTYLSKAEKAAPQAYDALRKVAIALSAVALSSLLTFSVAQSVALYSGLTFTASYFATLPILTIAIDAILHQWNATSHFFDLRAAALVLAPKEKKWGLGLFTTPAYIPAPAPLSAPSASAPVTAPVHTMSVKYPERLALFIGCNYAGTNYRLKNCISDTLHNQGLLRTADFPPENFIVMTDDTKKGNATYPSAANIVAQLTERITKANDLAKTHSGTVLYVSISGHGTLVADTDGDEKGGKDSVFVGADMEFILDDRFKGITNELHKDAKAFFHVDCCHSGTILDNPNNYTVDYTRGTPQIMAEETGDETDHGLIVLLSGCSDPQTSSDGKDFGAMTAAAKATIEEHHYELTYRQLLIGTNDKLRRAGITNQNPQLSSSRPLNLDDKVFVNDVKLALGRA